MESSVFADHEIAVAIILTVFIEVVYLDGRYDESTKRSLCHKNVLKDIPPARTRMIGLADFYVSRFVQPTTANPLTMILAFVGIGPRPVALSKPSRLAFDVSKALARYLGNRRRLPASAFT